MDDDGAGHERPRPGGPGGRIDLRDVKRLVHLMDVHGLSELELEDEGRRVRLRKGAPGSGAADPAPAGVGALALPFPAPAPAADAPATPPAAGKGVEIRSPMVGTFYRAPSPDASPFAEVGDQVRKDSVVCIIEAMKVMNEIKAEVEGEILAVLVQNGEAVEFDQPLFLVKPPAAAAPAAE